MKLTPPFIGSLAAFLVLDFLWLGVVMPEFYRANIGHLMSDTVNFIPAVIFYLLFLAGLFIFAVLPGVREGKARRAGTLGAILGLVAYGTYDLSNMATLEDWPLIVVAADMLWGTFLAGITAVIGFALVRMYNKGKEEAATV